MIFIAKVRGLSVVWKFMSVSTNIVFSAWHHPTSPRVGFKRNLYHLLFQFPFATACYKIHCALQNSFHTAQLIMHFKIHCAMKNSLWVAKFTAHYKTHCALQNSLCSAKSPSIKKICILIINFNYQYGLFWNFLWIWIITSLTFWPKISLTQFVVLEKSLNHHL